MTKQTITIEEFRTIWYEEYNETTMTHLVMSDNDISVIAQTEEKSNQIAEWMTKEHSRKYTVREITK